MWRDLTFSLAKVTDVHSLRLVEDESSALLLCAEHIHTDCCFNSSIITEADPA